MVRVKSGSVFEFDTGVTACKPFGFYAGERVSTPEGPATGN